MLNILHFLKEYILFAKEYLFIFNIFFMIVIIFSERKTPVHSLFWVFLLFFAPYLGLLTFLIFGLSLKKTRFINKYHGKIQTYPLIGEFFHHNPLSAPWKTLVQYITSSQSGSFSSYDESTFFSEGIDFFDSLKKDISSANSSIYLEFFIFKDDPLGLEFFSLISKKAQEGVSVKLLLDGTNLLSFMRVKKLKAAGIGVEFFFPLYLNNIFSFKLNYRNHRKLAIIDCKIAYIGGFNIGQEYIGKSYLGNWHDLGMRVKGKIISEFEKEFASSWDFARKSKKNSSDLICPISLNNTYQENHHAQLISGGPHYQVRTIRDNFLKLITGAKKYIYLETPYFIPDETILSALKIAAVSGVKIKIVIPNKGDHPFIYWVNQAFLGELLEYGIDFYHYTNGFLHGKFMIVDDIVATMGSANFDYRSFYDNFELNINIYSPSEVIKLRNIFINDLKHSELITSTVHEKRSVFTKAMESIFRLLSPIL